MVIAKTEFGHTHRYVFLRQEERNVGPDRVPEWLIQDIFYCEGCLTYASRDVRKEVPDRQSFGRLVTWRAPMAEALKESPS